MAAALNGPAPDGATDDGPGTPVPGGTGASAVAGDRSPGRYRRLSHWLSTVDDDLTPRPALPGDRLADVVIVGAGYTGLWTAYYLAVAEPSLRIVVLEKEIAGFGASGRNGGWCSALLPTSVPALARRHGRDAAVAMQRAMHTTVAEVGRVVAAEGIDCDWAAGGTVVLARSAAQLHRARAAVAEARMYGFGPEDLTLLGAAEAARHCAATGVLGGTYTPHCAAVHPAKLVRGLAAAVARRGVTIHEQTPVSTIRAGAAVTRTGTVRAPVVVRATEGYTPTLPGQHRALVPVYSLMLATEPLPEATWDRIGLAERQTFSDHRHVIIYGQRTRDGRLAFGGRGAPYHFGSRVHPSYDREPRVFAALSRALTDLFPVLGPELPVSHTWGGPLGVPRDWSASVGLDRSTGLAWAGGYVGDGVDTSTSPVAPSPT
ncbi:NAD(P)/FAD-dependent oxidoreductase [Micromonospora sp. CPCC 206060]|uniref:NAD(P)/FAD-dependent oxidoreductase n=1 Tax=Micromonospora sp. CPCC 206060 TaxID=3122406 RepID=UPI003FA58408